MHAFVGLYDIGLDQGLYVAVWWVPCMSHDTHSALLYDHAVCNTVMSLMRVPYQLLQHLLCRALLATATWYILARCYSKCF